MALDSNLSNVSRLEEENDVKFITNECIFRGVDKKWGWKEEILLLQSVEVCGLFNWEKIASLLNSIRNDVLFEAGEVQNHFSQYYINGTLGQLWNYQLTKTPVLYYDHTEGEPANANSSSKYLPLVGKEDLKIIKFLPHREEFEIYPEDISELMVTQLDFSSFYMNNLAILKIEDEIKGLQLAIVDSYRRNVANRIALRKFMKKFKLIEQYFFAKPSTFPFVKPMCNIEKHFQAMKKFIPLFDTSSEFLDFYYSCLKENLLKLEISRLAQAMRTKNKGIKRNVDEKVLLEKQAPSFLNAALLLRSDENIAIHRTRRKKRKFKFTRRKGSR